MRHWNCKPNYYEIISTTTRLIIIKSFFFFWRWGICILANFSLSLFITGTLQTNSVSLIETHFTYTISHSIPFLLVKDFECERLFLAILRQTKIIWFLIQVLHYKFLNPIVVVIAQRTHTHTHTKVNLYTKSTSYISSPFFFHITSLIWL